jgi:hypothetical protein
VGNAIVMGRDVALWEAHAFSSADGKDSTVRTFSRGLRVWDTSAKWELGRLRFKASVPPAEVRVPTWVYPVGPAMIVVDAGAQFEVDLRGEVQPFLYYPVQLTTVQATAAAGAAPAARAPGARRVFLVRTGVEGRVNLVDGSLTARAQFRFDGSKPNVNYSGKVDLLSGRVLAFFDMRGLFSGWKRIWDKTLFDWKGFQRVFSNDRPNLGAGSGPGSGGGDVGDF